MTRGVVPALLLLAFGPWADPGLAQELRVKSGEHADFTRLVIPIGADRDWTLGGTLRDPVIRFSPAIPDLDLRGVFDLVPRQRLLALTQDAGLALTLACDCPLRLFRFQDSLLVIDITDPGTVEATLAPVAPPLQMPPRQAALAGADAAALARTARDDAALAQETAEILGAQIARAAAAGLLEAAPLRPMSQADPRDAPADAPPVQGAAPALAGLGLRAETALDRVNARGVPGQPDFIPLSCPDPFAPAAMPPDGGLFWHDLGRLRMAALDDRDRIVPEGALALALHHLNHALGEEALFWLGLVPDPPALPLALARHLAGQPAFAPPAPMLACGGAVILLRYLSGDTGDGLDGDQIAAALQAFAALPAPLRDHLGPDLARRLQEDGRLAAARDIRDALVRGQRLAPGAQTLLDIDILGPAAIPDAEVALDDILRADTTRAAEAMERFLALNRASGDPVPPDRLLAARAMLRENPTPASTTGLWHEVLLAEARAGSLDEVMQMLDAVAESGQRDALLSDLFAQARTMADVPGLILLITSHGAAWRDAGQTALRRDIAALMLETGLPDLAWRIAPEAVPIGPTGPQTTDGRDPGQGTGTGADGTDPVPPTTGPQADFADLARTDPAIAWGEGPLRLEGLRDMLAESATTRATIATVLAETPGMSPVLPPR